jgi:hypothetical protein
MRTLQLIDMALARLEKQGHTVGEFEVVDGEMLVQVDGVFLQYEQVYALVEQPTT